MSAARQRLLSTPGRILLVVTSLLGAMAFLWPFLVATGGTADSAHGQDAPWLLLVLAPLLLVLVGVEVSRGRIDARGIAVLGILAACGTALRIPSPGVAGLEPLFFLLVLAGRVYGPGFGFALGGLTLLVSGIATGYTAGACLLYGTVMNLWFWPFGAGGASSIAYVAGAGLATNLRHFVAFDLATSLGFDVPRAVLNALLVLAVGAPVLVALRRAASRTALGPVAPERSEVAEAA